MDERTRKNLWRELTWSDLAMDRSDHFELHYIFTLARRCLFIAPTPPGPLRILELEFFSLRQHLDRRFTMFISSSFPPFSAVLRKTDNCPQCMWSRRHVRTDAQQDKMADTGAVISLKKLKVFSLFARFKWELVMTKECNGYWSSHLFYNFSVK